MEEHNNLKTDYLKGEVHTTLNENEEQHLDIHFPKDTESSYFSSLLVFRHKLRTDNIFQEMFIYAMCLYICKFLQGWCQSLFGPSYIDIMMISGTDLAQGSWILTSRFIGSMIGSTIQGLLYGRSNNKFTFGSALCGTCIVLALIPWCSLFEAMVCAHVLLGIMHGIYASGTSTEILRVWKEDGRVVLIGSQLMLSFGSATAPLVFAPFLVEYNVADVFNSSSTATIENSTTEYALQHEPSNIFIPFSITSLMSLFSAMFFFVLYLKYDRTFHCPEKKKCVVTRKVRKLPKPLKVIIIQLFGLVLFLFAVVNEVFSGFLATYCVQYFRWSKKDGAFVTFLFFLFGLIAQLTGVLVNKWANTIIYTVGNFILIFLSILGMLVASVYRLDALAWIFVSVLGFAKGTTFALILSWTNDYILPMTGRISGFYYVCLMAGGAINPVLFGYIMENIGLIWFCHVFVIESFIMLIIIACLAVATKYVVKHFGHPLYHPKTIKEDEIVNSDPR